MIHCWESHNHLSLISPSHIVQRNSFTTLKSHSASTKRNTAPPSFAGLPALEGKPTPTPSNSPFPLRSSSFEGQVAGGGFSSNSHNPLQDSHHVPSHSLTFPHIPNTLQQQKRGIEAPLVFFSFTLHPLPSLSSSPLPLLGDRARRWELRRWRQQRLCQK